MAKKITSMDVEFYSWLRKALQRTASSPRGLKWSSFKAKSDVWPKGLLEDHTILLQISLQKYAKADEGIG